MDSKSKWIWGNYVVLIYVVLLQGWWSTSEGCLEQERLALLQIKHFFNPPNTFFFNDPNSFQNWVNENSDCCQWERVECNNSSTTPRVIKLDLSSIRTSTEEWYLNASLFTPFEQLESLNLNLNLFSGCVDNQGMEKLSRLRNLKILDLGNNLFNNTILSSLDGFSSLRELYLYYNRLKGTVDIKGLGSLSDLEKLDMSRNDIVKFASPKGLCKLVHLQEFHIDNNNMSGILPWCLANLTSLRLLDISFNQISGSISSSPLRYLTSMEELIFSNNHFQVPISLEPFFNLSKLKKLHGENNQIIKEPAESSHSLTPKFQLKSIKLSGYGDGGAFPKFLYHQHDLEDVDLSHVNLEGEFPNWLLDNNTALSTLFLANNSLSGPFQLPVHPHKFLQTLDISDNSLHGHIPDEVGAYFPYLFSLNISRNTFNGSIPASVGDMNFLGTLDLSNNQLTGEIPQHLAIGCFNLFFLVLSNNSLQGHIFSENLNLPNLMILQLDGNNFTGEIPEILSNSYSLVGLYLSDNHLTGRIPGWLGNLTKLEDITMANNHFEGPIPSEFCQLNSLKVLDLSNNSISGNLPSCFSPPFIRQVHLSKNKIEGEINDVFGHSSFLETLDLSYNRLNGRIPNWIDRFAHLSYLILANNSLEGEMPIQLCRLNQLRLIDLSRNYLSGQIPSCLYNTAMHEDYYDALAPNWDLAPSFSPQPAFEASSPEGPSMRSEETIPFTTKNMSYYYKGKPLDGMFGIDLSCNLLTGEIPPQIGYLTRIRALNLSHNSLTGSIPETFSNLKQIESLDLSYNKLNGNIPPQLVELNQLAVFSVAHNNLSGKIPERTAQFITFNENSYEDNPFLCGLPLQKSCNKIGSPSLIPKASLGSNREDNIFIDMDSFYLTFTISYLIVILGIVAVLYVNPFWRLRWFSLVETWMNSCYYFIIDHLIHARCCRKNM